MKTAITGATGQLGRLVVRRLTEKAGTEDVVALARSVEKASDLGVEVREADYSRPETLERALTGIEKLLLISSSEVGKRAEQHRNIVDAAKKTGVKWIVYTSLLHADTSTLDLAEEHRETEKTLKDSGIPFTILRNGWYTENYAGSIPGAVTGGAFLGSVGAGKISSASRTDFADAAVAVITGTGHEGKTYELAGDEAYTLSDLAAEISRQTGKNIPYKNLPEHEYVKALQGFGLPDGVARMIAGWDTAAAEGALFDDGRQLSALIGRPTTAIADTVATTLSQAGLKSDSTVA